MKPLNSMELNVKLTPRQELITELLKCLSSEDIDLMYDQFNSVLSRYDIKKCELKSIQAEIPKNLIGKVITVEFKEFCYTGELLGILYRDTPYSVEEFRKMCEHPDMSEEQRELLKFTMYEEANPKIYHRLVLNDIEKDILIIPYLVGVNLKE